MIQIHANMIYRSRPLTDYVLTTSGRFNLSVSLPKTVHVLKECRRNKEVVYVAYSKPRLPYGTVLIIDIYADGKLIYSEYEMFRKRVPFDQVLSLGSLNGWIAQRRETAIKEGLI